MAIQVPGAVLFILSLTSRPGVDWTSWMPYAVTAAMQAGLLVCSFFEYRPGSDGSTHQDLDPSYSRPCMER